MNFIALKMCSATEPNTRDCSGPDGLEVGWGETQRGNGRREDK
jgi:hypothetical protein